jgi:hypothetical protein
MLHLSDRPRLARRFRLQARERAVQRLRLLRETLVQISTGVVVNMLARAILAHWMGR